jgi:YD repeat-containing protein
MSMSDNLLASELRPPRPDGNRLEVAWAYDGAGRKTSQVMRTVTAPVLGSAAETDPAARSTVADGGRHAFGYSPADRLTGQTGRGAERIGTGYDPDGNPVSIADSTLDEAGRTSTLTSSFYLDGLLRSTGDGASTTRYGYDGAGQVSVREHGGDGGTPERTTFGYNDAGARTSTASTATVPAGQAWTAGYDPAGRLVREQAPNGQLTTHRYHPDDTLHVKRTVADGSAGAELVAQWSYRYDNLFRQLSQTHDGQVVNADADSDHRYGYDPAGRVVEFFDGPGATRQHTAAFDANGNRISYTTAGVGTQTTRYAADNSLASTTDLDGANPRASSYTAFGALAGDGCYSYGYDGFDRLASTAGDANVLRCATAPATRYAYDGLDRQRQRTETSVTAPAVSTALHYDGLSTAVASEAVDGLADTTRAFTLTPGGAAVSVTSSGGALSSPTSSYLLDDGTGTITTITGDQPSSTASGFTTCTARFHPWGTPTTGTGATSTETGTCARGLEVHNDEQRRVDRRSRRWLMPAPEEMVGSVSSRDELAAFIGALQRELREDPASWENGTLESFLEALAAWTQDMDGYLTNAGREPIAEPSWRTFAEMLIAARVYE